MSAPTPGFRRRGALHQWTLHFGPNMTPMVDVVMVILIFFMASAAFVGEEWFLRAAIPVEGVPGKPSHPISTELPPPRINVVMEWDEATATTRVTALQLQREPVERLLELFATYKDQPPEVVAGLEVLIKPTPNVPYRDVVRVHEACEGAGITKVGIGVTREASPGAPAAPINP